MTNFVFEGTEVQKTGRRAKREVKVGAGAPARVFELYEITPIGDDFDWKKWVREDELYEIVE